MLKDQSREKTKSLLGLKRKTGLSFETGRACRPDVTGKKRSAASATTRQKIVEATSNAKLSSTPRPLDISILPFCAFRSWMASFRRLPNSILPFFAFRSWMASYRRLPNHVFATFTASRCRAAIGRRGLSTMANQTHESYLRQEATVPGSDRSFGMVMAAAFALLALIN